MSMPEALLKLAEVNAIKLPVKYSETPQFERGRVREAYIKQQKGLCHYCGAPLDGPPAAEVADKTVSEHLFPENFFTWPVHLHHCHATDLTIGAVHAHCNAVLWEYEGE